MDLSHLIRMANQIGDFFAPMPDRDESMAGVAEHLRKFWDPRMRTQLLAAIDAGDAPELHAIVTDAVAAHRASLQPH